MRVERVRDLVARLHAQPRRHLTLVVAVDGPARPGRTELVTALAAADPEIEIVPMADFSLPRDRRRDPDGPAPSAGTTEVGWRRLRSELLLPLSRDRAARYEAWDGETGLPRGWREVPVGGIVVVEGIYACLRQLIGFYDFRIWAEAPRLRPAEDAYVAEHDPAGGADLRVDGSGTLAYDRSREYVRLWS